MEKYSGTQTMEEVPVDPTVEWTVRRGRTRLAEPMRQSGLQSYPERPNEPECIYYLRTGFCGYGNRCRFNHPRDRGAAMEALRASGGEYPERFGQPICQYYMRTGMCKFGASCKYHHPRRGIGSSSTAIMLNVFGYPLQPEEKECSYYIKTGQCRFGAACKFHHPEPAGVHAQAPPVTPPGPLPTHAVYPNVPQQYGILPGNWPLARPAMVAGSYVPGNYGPMLFPPGVVSFPGWTPYPAPVSPGAALPSSQPTVGSGPPYGVTQVPSLGTAYIGPSLSSAFAGRSSDAQRKNLFPERPGQPECQYYLRTGDCKFGSMCKYHHPPELLPSFSLSPIGLPLRPGAPLCSHYTQNGVCKFGPSCKFDHPMRMLSYGLSASPSTKLPVTRTTLAPSSSSSNMRLEFLSGFTQDTFSPQISSVNISSASTFSKAGPSQSIVLSSSFSTGGSHGGGLDTSR